VIQKTHLIEDDNGYKKYNYFEISKGLKEILAKDYHLYNSSEFENSDLVENLYKTNFIDKYDEVTQKEVFDLYINNEEFKKKAQFIYSIIDNDKYIKFVNENSEIANPNELTIKYSILDSSGVKVQIYHVSIIDISFVF